MSVHRRAVNGEWLRDRFAGVTLLPKLQSMSQMSSTVRVRNESSKITSKLGRLLAQMLALLRTLQSGNKQKYN